MPRQPATPKAKQEPQGFTPERFENELKDLASKAQSDTWGRHAASQAALYAQSLVLLVLLGVYSNVSQLALSPVYGTIPASAWHSKLVMTGCFVGWALNVALRRLLGSKTALLLPLVAAYVPVVQFYLYGLSETMGAQWGPALTEGLTLFPLLVLSASCVADYLEGADMSWLPSSIKDAAPGIGSWSVLKLSEHLVEKHLQVFIGKTFLYTRMGMELLLAASYAFFAPSRYLIFAIPALLHTGALNTHVLAPYSTSSLNTTMASEGWLLLDRRESLTGYVSVLENLDQGFRVLRCDHSLLGGEWTQYKSARVAEPIYGVFVMLEAVRLVEREEPVADTDASALVVGLGVGTTPSAFVTHGIDTTVVEIDPVVHEFALKYFDLRENNAPVLADAVSYTSMLAKESTQRFDYIVHDVFTGGAEPVDLFTIEFLQGLASLLKPDGVIAINYAGDFNLPASAIIVRTIKQVFPSCRIFRESPIDTTAAEAKSTDFTNMVILCKKTDAPLTLRRPVHNDYLDSLARQAFLEPQHEVLLGDMLAVGDKDAVLRRNSTDKVTEWHKTSAAAHWAIMRTVLPPSVWERW